MNSKYGPLFLQKGRFRYFFMIGGRSGGRSYAASQFVTANLQGPEFFRCALMRFVASDIRTSIFLEVKDRIEEQELEDVIEIRDQKMEFQCGNNLAKGIGFRKSSEDQKGKLKSLAGFNAVVIEEADEVAQEDFMQLDDSLRTTKGQITIIFMLNAPPKNHWIIKMFFNLIPSGVERYYKIELKPEYRDRALLIFTTFLDNIRNINLSTLHNFMSYRTSRPDYYYNVIKGYVSEGARGRIFTNWKRISNAEYEELPYPKKYGLDFGFSNDPTALTEIREHNERVYLKELIYETGLTNADISQRLTNLGVSKSDVIYADSAEPKSIEELRRDGWNVIPAEKGAGSVNAGIDRLLSKEVYYTEESANIDLEQQEYKWALDRNKEPTNTPIDKYNHAMDSVRYGTFTTEEFIGFA